MLGNQSSLDPIAIHAFYEQSAGSHCWYMVAGPPALSRSLFSASLTTGSVEKSSFSPAGHSDL